MVTTDVDEDDGETALAAMGCVTAIRRILNSAQDNKELLGRLEEKIFPIILFSITPDGLDSIEDGLDCATILLYYKEKG
jgi:importin-7